MMSSVVEKTNRGKIRISRPNGGQVKFRMLMVATALFTVIGFFLLDYSGLELWPAIVGTFENLKTMFLMP